MSVLDISEKPTTSNSIAFKANAKKTPKLKMIKHETSLSEQEDSHKSSSSDEDDDQEFELLMRKFSRLSNKIGKNGYIFDPKKGVFVQVEVIRKRHAIIVVRRNTSLQIASNPSRKDPPPRISKYKNQVMMRRTTIRTRTRDVRRKRAIIRRSSSSQRRKGKT
jgi:hypothetical protein